MKDSTRKAVINDMALSNYFGPRALVPVLGNEDLDVLELKPSRGIRKLSDIDKRKRDKKESRWDRNDD